jgi:hypothetical protein
MKKQVICVDDKKLPPGAEIVEGQEYTVVESFVNNYDQIVYMIAGIRNHGRTKYGLPWIGYSAIRFNDLEKVKEEEVNYNYQLN